MFKFSEEHKYRIAWIIGTLVSICVYYSGIYFIFLVYRKKIRKRFCNIVLTYHRIRDDRKAPHISVSIKNFRNQIKFLKKFFKITSLTEMLGSVKSRKQICCDRLAITFDDGFKDNYQNAFPILQEFEIPATIFLVSRLIDYEPEMLNFKEIKEIKEKGLMQFGSHSATHQILSNLDDETAVKEIVGSKTALEKLLGQEVPYFAYPHGKAHHFKNDLKEVVRKAGYQAAFSTENGDINLESDPFALNRIGIRNCYLFVFKVRLSGFFECRIIKFIRSLFNIK